MIILFSYVLNAIMRDTLYGEKELMDLMMIHKRLALYAMNLTAQ